MRKILSQFDTVNILKHGIYGFLIFLLIIITSKLLSNLIVQSNHFNISINDILTASLGFFILVIIKLVERFSNSN